MEHLEDARIAGLLDAQIKAQRLLPTRRSAQMSSLASEHGSISIEPVTQLEHNISNDEKQKTEELKASIITRSQPLATFGKSHRE
jgi:hypothetical protein